MKALEKLEFAKKNLMRMVQRDQFRTREALNMVIKNIDQALKELRDAEHQTLEEVVSAAEAQSHKGKS